MTRQPATNSLGVAAVPALRQFISQALKEGLDVARALTAANISQQVAEDNAQYISGDQFQRFLSELLTQSNNPLFGLHASQFVQPSSYGVLGYLTMNCLTLGEAVAQIQPYERLVGDMGVTQVHRQDQYIRLVWTCQYTQPDVRHALVDNCLGSWVRFAQYLLADNLEQPSSMNMGPNKVTLKRADLCTTDYEHWFQCPVEAGNDQDAVYLPAEFLEMKLSQGNSHLFASLRQQADQQLAVALNSIEGNNTLSHQVVQVITQQLPAWTTQQQVASYFAMTVKTLQRKLKQEGTQFRDLVDQVRIGQAKNLLATTSLSMADISERVGYQEPRSFYRAFNRIEHMTPGEYRELVLGQKAEHRA